MLKSEGLKTQTVVMIPASLLRLGKHLEGISPPGCGVNDRKGIYVQLEQRSVLGPLTLSKNHSPGDVSMYCTCTFFSDMKVKTTCQTFRGRALQI